MGIAAEETINDAAAPTDRRHPPTLIRHPLSRELCRRIGWFKPDEYMMSVKGPLTRLY